MRASDKGYFVFSALFFVLCAFFILNSCNSMSLSKLGSESIAPENLRSVGYRFKLSLSVEENSKSIDDFSKSNSWLELESRLNAYADRLELYQKQDRFRQYLVVFLYVAATIGMVAFAATRKRSISTGVQQDADDRLPARAESKAERRFKPQP